MQLLKPYSINSKLQYKLLYLKENERCTNAMDDLYDSSGSAVI